MESDPSSPEVRDALEELQLYLSDILPPLVVADAFKVLLKYPPPLTASSIENWTASHFRLGSPIQMSDYVFYAVKKIFLIGEFRLVPREPFEPFLEELKQLVLAFTPEAERPALREKLTRIAESRGPLTASVDALIRENQGLLQRAAAAPLGLPLSPEELRDFRHFTLLVERLGERIGATGASAVATLLTAAARSSHDPQQLTQNLERLREVGVEVEPSSMFRTLAESLPGWVPPELPPASAAEGAGQHGLAAGPPQNPPESAAAQAMHRIVAQSEDPSQLTERFTEMVRTAIKSFNEGALPQAVTMIGLAERIVREKRVDPGAVEAVRSKGDEALDLERLRQYAEVQRDHRLLRRVLSFFPATSPKGLLDELRREMKRERRKLMLQLLEVHGLPARREALERLRPPFGQAEGDEKWYFRRNLLYLLRRIPPARADAPAEEDVDAAVRHAVLRFPAPLVKEAVANLGQLKNEKAENALLTLLDDLEMMLIKPGASSRDPREVRLLLDRVVAALARFGTARARRAVVDHGLTKRTELGDTVSRLSELAGQDLSGDADLVERLLTALKASSPRKVLGIVLAPRDPHAKNIIEALSTTRSPFVRHALEDLARRFPALEAGTVAARSLASLDSAVQAPTHPSDTRSGELDLFGLPGLVQELAEAGLSGSLTLRDAEGKTIGEAVILRGRLKSCEARSLKGEEAFYHLFERPAAGFFLFERKTADKAGEEDPESLPGILPLCLEGMRRYDELQQASALVPDAVKLRPTDARPEPHPDEHDGMFVNRLWKMASGGATPRDCEEELPADSYRIRRQLAFWVESGALAASESVDERS